MGAANGKTSAANGKLRVTLVKGTNSCRADHRSTVRGLGLKRISQTVELADTPAIRGMLNKVSYLVKVADR